MFIFFAHQFKEDLVETTHMHHRHRSFPRGIIIIHKLWANHSDFAVGDLRLDPHRSRHVDLYEDLRQNSATGGQTLWHWRRTLKDKTRHSWCHGRSPSGPPTDSCRTPQGPLPQCRLHSHKQNEEWRRRTRADYRNHCRVADIAPTIIIATKV